MWRAELIWDFTRENSAVVNAFIKNKSVKGPAYTRSWTSTAKLHYHLHLSQNVGTTKRQISLPEELMIGATSSPGPLDSRHFHDPKTIVVLSCVEFAFWAAAAALPHHHASHQPPLHHHKPWTMISGEIFGKMFINVWLQSCWKYRQCEYAKRQFFSWGLKA